MTKLPNTLDEVHERILVRFQRLHNEGYSRDAAYNMVMRGFKKLKIHYKDKKGDYVDKCKVCRNPILHQVEDYTVCANNAHTDFWHDACINPNETYD